MSRSLQKQWTCLRCLRQSGTAAKGRRRGIASSAISTSKDSTSSRGLATAAPTTASASSLNQAPFRQPERDHDDANLRHVFDSASFWASFSQSRRPSSSPFSSFRPSAGLLQNHYLTDPAGFSAFADATLEKCRQLVARILGASTLQAYRQLIRDMDRLSDLLCRVIDLADFVRNTHPDPKFQRAAAGAHALMFEYMNTLNTTTGLNDQLKRALADEQVTSTWTAEELRAANILKKDFSQSAIDLPEDKRRQFVSLSNEVSELGARFIEEMLPQPMWLKVDGERLKGVDPMALRHYAGTSAVRGGRVTVPTSGPLVSHILRYAEDESLRREVYIASRTATERQVRTLEHLLETRSEIAQLSGFDTYARMALTDKMAQTPEAVMKFLDALTDDNAPAMGREIGRMLEMKRRAQNDATGINAWDRDYYRGKLAAESGDKPSVPARGQDFLPSYFSLGTVMQGLSRLFSRLYGVRFVPREPAPGETWTPDVRRLDVVDDDQGGQTVAVIYCDLFAREGKSPNPAHFTLRCSRRIDREEIEEAQYQSDSPATRSADAYATAVAAANDGMATAPAHLTDGGPDTGAVYQLPTIALVCDFPPPASPHTPPLLPLSHLTTLFHEMGHAMHSALGRTRLQNVAGTRCATDFAELPSVLHERFATHPAVLALYARHWESDAPLPAELARELVRRSGGAGEADDAADTEAQIRLALLDQAFHGEAPGGGRSGAAWSSDAVYHGVEDRFAARAAAARGTWDVVKEPREARWQGFFGHLVGYGGSYYSYLFDRAIAGRVWEAVFLKGGKGDGESVLSREAGERFKREVLSWGGSRDGWECVAKVLGEEGAGLEQGGEKAMEEVGRWGLK